MSHTPQPVTIEERLNQAASVPDLLDASFNAFEAIRITARRHQDDVPGLFAAFMMTADAAVDGREALTVAPSLPLHGGTEPAIAGFLDADAGHAADCLARFAAVLCGRLSQAAAQADTHDDQAACQQAAQAARRIRELMTR